MKTNLVIGKNSFAGLAELMSQQMTLTGFHRFFVAFVLAAMAFFSFAETIAPKIKYSGIYGTAFEAEYAFYTEWRNHYYGSVSGCGFGQLTWTETPTQVLGDIPNQCGGPCGCGHILPVTLSKTLQCPEGSILGNGTCTCVAPLVGNAAFDACVPVGAAAELDPTQPLEAGMCTRRPIIPATGEKFYTETDYIGGGSHALSVVRTFRSSWSIGGLRGLISPPGLGQAWSHNHAVSLMFSGGPVTLARVLFGDGRVSAFTRFDEFSNWTAANGSDTLVPVTTGSGGYLLTLADDDSKWRFDLSGRLSSVVQRNGQVATYTYSDDSTSVAIAPHPGLLISVTNSFGRSLGFVYNSAAQLTKIIFLDGQIIRYAFDSMSRLTNVIYPGGSTRTYLYEDATWPQSVTGIVDERGNRLATVVYDAQGRGLESGYAGGADRYIISYGATSTDPVLVTDPLGTQRSYSYGTALKKLAVTASSLPAGVGGSDAMSRVQNASGLIDSETDFLGVQTTHAWDINRRLLLTTTKAANQPQPQTTSTQWHPTFRLPVLTVQPGRAIVYTYDAAGNKLAETITDTATSQTRIFAWTYNAMGLMATSTDPNNHSVSYSYYTDTTLAPLIVPSDLASLLLHGDGTNNSTNIADSSPSPKAVVANGGAQISTAQSKFGGSSIYFGGAIDSNLSLPISTDLTIGRSDFTVEAWIYVPSWTSDATITFGSTFNSLQIGRQGNTSNFGVAALGTSWALTTSSLPPTGVWTHVAVTRSGTAAKIFYNGVLVGSGTVSTDFSAPITLIGAYFGGYIDELRITKGLARYTEAFTPPAAAFVDLVSMAVNATDIGHTVGDLQSVTNAAGHVTQFTQYDRAGRVRQMVDPKGVVTDISYTLRGWVSTVTTTAPGGTPRVSSYSYDGVGQLTGVTQPDGATLRYNYDAAHRLVGVTDAKGNSVSYTLDNVGNRIGEDIKDPTGALQRSISRSFDALNRLQQVTGAAH